MGLKNNLAIAESGFQFLTDSFLVSMGYRPRKPLVVGYTINTICNLRCSYCFIGTDSEHHPEGFSHKGLQLPEVKKILSNIRKDTSCLIITGGEPFLYKEFEEVLKYAKETANYANLSVATNGLFLQKRRECLPYIDRLGISFDLTREREYPKQLASLLEDLKHLKSEGLLPPLHFTMTLLPNEDTSQLPRFLEFCRAQGFKLWIQPVRDHDDFDKWEWFIQTAENIARTIGEYNLLNNLSAVREFRKDGLQKSCFPETRIHINHDGTMAYPCLKLENRHSKNSVIDTSPMELWRQQEQAHGTFPNKLCGSCGFSCYFETSEHYRRPLSFINKAYRHVLRG